jgi:hypothetical protein
MLTIAISVASGADAVFSLLPGRAEFEAVDRVGIGPRESIKVLLPIFLGFFVTPRAAYPLRYPLLLAFLGLGMLAGEGPGGIRFRDFHAAYLIGSTGLAIILFESLFDGGLRTDPGDGYWRRVLLSLEVDYSRLAPALLRLLSHEPKWVRQLSYSSQFRSRLRGRPRRPVQSGRRNGRPADWR